MDVKKSLDQSKHLAGKCEHNNFPVGTSWSNDVEITLLQRYQR